MLYELFHRITEATAGGEPRRPGDAEIAPKAEEIQGYKKVPLDADCTRCGICVDICPASALKFEFKGLAKRHRPRLQARGWRVTPD